jgi:hypothetical protein
MTRILLLLMLTAGGLAACAEHATRAPARRDLGAAGGQRPDAADSAIDALAPSATADRAADRRTC